MYPEDYVNDPYVIGENYKMVSINSALQVDVLGQAAADTLGPRQFSGVGGQVDFIRGAARSAGGKSIIALPSTAARGTVSRITAVLDLGAAVTTSRNDIDYVITEYGIAALKGKTVRERMSALISIAHPDFRQEIRSRPIKFTINK
jgi:4-hydroxybutyrate CoA-transferase